MTFGSFTLLFAQYLSVGDNSDDICWIELPRGKKTAIRAQLS
jgi:hypothetical protein